jgi:O-antigen/teichoic acid export membrane protein
MADHTDSSSQIKRGVILSYVSLFLTNISGLFVTPYMLSMFGKSEYGLYMLIGSIVGYLAFLDFGLENSIVRYVARYRALNDGSGEQNFLAMAMLTYIGIGLIASLVGILLYFNLDSLFGGSLTAEEMSKASIMFAILMFNVTISFPSGAITAIVTGHERFAYAKSIDIVRFILRTALLVILLYLGYKAIAVVVLDTIMTLLLLTSNAIYVLFKLRVRFVLHRFDKKLIYEIVVYSFWMSVALVFAQLYPRIGQIVLGMKEGTSSVAVFAIAALLASYYGSLGYIFTNLLLPHATKLVARQASSMELTDMMIRVGRIQFLILSYVLGGFVLFGYQFIVLWVGKGYSEAWIIALVMMIPSTEAIIRDVGVSIQQAQNRNVFRAFYCMYLAFATGVFSLLARNFFDGPLAMGVGLMATVSIGNVIMILYYARIIKIDMKRFHVQVYFPQIFCMSLATVLGGVMVFYSPVTGWMMLAVEIAVYSSLYGVITWFIGMNPYEKQLCLDLLGALTKRLRLHSVVAH